MGWRIHAKFYWEPGFREVYISLNDSIRPKIVHSTKRFEQDWRKSNVDNDISGSFDFTPYPADGPWRFIELHLGYDYRAFVMFPDGRIDAYWLHLFKKPGQKVPPKEIRLARSRAIDCWNTIQGSV